MTPRLLNSTKLLAVGALSVASVLLSGFLLRRGVTNDALRILVALLPVPFFIAFIAAELQWIRESDEFHRRVLLESLAMAFPAAIVVAVVVEALQKAGLLAGWTIGDVWPLMALLWVPALWIARRRYR